MNNPKFSEIVSMIAQLDAALTRVIGQTPVIGFEFKVRSDSNGACSFGGAFSYGITLECCISGKYCNTVAEAFESAQNAIVKSDGPSGDKAKRIAGLKSQIKELGGRV